MHKLKHVDSKRSSVALKIIDLTDFTEIDIQLLKFNLKSMKTMSHSNIVQVNEWIIIHKTAFILSDFIEGGEFFDKIIRTKMITDKAVASVIMQVLSALQFAHAKGVYHLDLKPENILLDNYSKGEHDYHIKIVDMGVNKFMGAENFLQIKLGQAKKGGSVRSFNLFSTALLLCSRGRKQGLPREDRCVVSGSTSSYFDERLPSVHGLQQ